MHTSLLFSRIALLSFLLTGFIVFPGAAQRQFATAVISSANAANPSLAADGTVATAARLSPPLVLGTAWVRVGFPAIVPRGGRAGLIVRPTGALDASLLENMSIRTYKNAVFQESYALTSLVSLSVLSPSSATSVEFVAGADFDQVELRATSLVNASVDLFLFEAYVYVNSLPLPVELMAFQGHPTAAGVVLTWKTASEANSSHFVVERMTSSQPAFQALGQVRAAGTSTQPRPYQFVDAAPESFNYYRLRQLDRDGHVAFSPVVTVRAAPTAAAHLRVYPNPAAETLTVAGPVGARLEVVDQLGRRVPGISLVAQQLDVRDLPDGIYFLRNAATGQNTKFVKAAGVQP
ncbi:T9SS type A sorting domain-containing protein [uncultured Hymenobacter sp.]|uniref:T9SS type A sorting domain-containing protein n=1 Tax=uncultured Hymenobacter sp. TaxID=170016 RepID=UPI0035CB2D6C